MGKDEIIAIEHHFLNAPLEEAMAYIEEDHVRYDFNPPLQYAGRDAVRKVFGLFFANAKNWKGEMLELDVEASEDLGVGYSLQRVTWELPNGKPASTTVRVTHCFRKVNGEWKMFHSHVSAPVHPLTGKAEMNLTRS